jgi:hypothetical protein
MSFLVAIEGVVVNSSITAGGSPAHVPHWPANGSNFRGSFVYSPAATPTPALFSNIFINFGSFTLTRHNGIGNISLVNGGAGIKYVDTDSTGFNNISLPAGGWELQEFDLAFTRPSGIGPTVNPAAIDFNLFSDRTVFATGDNGALTNSLVWSLLTRIDVAIVLPA